MRQGEERHTALCKALNQELLVSYAKLIRTRSKHDHGFEQHIHYNCSILYALDRLQEADRLPYKALQLACPSASAIVLSKSLVLSACYLRVQSKPSLS
jgi:hypothetical protein